MSSVIKICERENSAVYQSSGILFSTGVGSKRAKSHSYEHVKNVIRLLVEKFTFNLKISYGYKYRNCLNKFALSEVL